MNQERGIISWRRITARLSISLLLLLYFIPAWTKATIYDGRDGLSSSDINAIAKDSRGLMWVGTYNGLNVYDGYTFNKVQGLLAGAHVNTLALNKARNEMLVGTTTGLYALDLATFRTTRLEQEQKTGVHWSGLAANAICVIPEKNDIYVAFGSGYLARMHAGDKLQLVCRLPDTSTRPISYIIPRDKDLLVSNGNVFRVNVQERKAYAYTEINTMAPFNFIGRSGNTLILNGFFSGFSLRDINTAAEQISPAVKQKLNHLPYRIQQSTIKNGQLYALCNNYTFALIDINNGSVNEISRKYPDIFEGRNYYCLFVDEHDIIWIGTNKGLIKVEDRPERFSRALYNFPARVSTRKMLEDKNGDIYVASYTGLWQWSAQTNTWRHYERNTEENTSISFDVQPLALYMEPQGNGIYIGYDGDRLLRFDKKRKQFEALNYPANANNKDLNSMYIIESDRKGKLWLGCGNGLASFDPEANELVMHRHDPFDVGRVRVRYICADPAKDLIYVTTLSGLYVIDINKGITERYNTATRPALTANDVLFADLDKEGKLWLGTNGSGINILSADRRQIQYIHKQQGLSSEVVYSILPQDENTFWISTFNGLDRYRKDQQSFSNFFEEDGLSSNEFNQNSFLKAADGRMYFGSINGITYFAPDKFSEPEPFSIFISGISQWNEKTQSVELSRNKIAQDNTIIKRPSDLLLELHFGCTDYTDPLRNSYIYRIKEISDSWITLEDRHTLNLGGIPYGDYTIEVKAINSRGVSSSNLLRYHIRVIQPFYRTWWFFTLILLGVALVFYSAYQIKYQGFKNILHLRMKIASNLHDEVGSLLTRITMFSENLRYSNNTEEQRNVKLEKIAVLSRNAIASMSDVLWTIDSRNDFAGNLLDRMREHAEEMLFPLGIDVNFVLSGTDLKQPITSDTRGEIYLIFKEAINNIAKHSGATRVEITYQINDRSFLLKIANNKSGETSNEISTGQGLNNMKMRAAKVGARITVENREEWFSVEIRS